MWDQKCDVRRKHQHVRFSPRPILLIPVWFLLLASPAYADPMLLQTGIMTGHTIPILIAGIALEALIIAWFIRKPFPQILVTTFLVNCITGFVGFIAILLVQLKGGYVFPIGPAAFFAVLIEAPVIALLNYDVPVKRVFLGVTAANFMTAIFALAFISQVVLPAPDPSVADDLKLARSVAIVHNAIEEFHDIYNYYPPGLIGGSGSSSIAENSDPLIASGILKSYPENPYSKSLRSLRLNPAYLILGLGDPASHVSLDSPTNAWEVRWFPAMSNDPRFGGLDHVLLCANGLSDANYRETLKNTFYNMNGADIIPGSIFYKSYDFSRDGIPDDYILGAFGWPTGAATIVVDIIDASTGDICLRLTQDGSIIPGFPDGIPEPLAMLYVAGTDSSHN